MNNPHETSNDSILASVASFLDQVKPITTLDDNNVPSAKELSERARELAQIQTEVVGAAKKNIRLGWETNDINIYISEEGNTSEFSILLGEEICHTIHPDLSNVNITHNDDPTALEPAQAAGLHTGNIIYIGGIPTEEHMEKQYAQWKEKLRASGFRPFSSVIPTDIPLQQTGYMFTLIGGNARKLVLAPLADPRELVMNIPPIAKVVQSRFTQRDLYLAKTILTIARDRLRAP